jgi:Flp pilus assembly protein protease CpaA
MIELFFISLALAGTFIASYIDIKTKEIPNILTFSMIFVGLILFFAKYYREWLFFIPLAASYFFIWILWRLGLWGGGDAKLVMGIISLISPFYGIDFIPVFFIVIGAVATIHYCIFGLVNEMREGKAIKFVTVIASMFVISFITYFVASLFLRSFAILLAVIAFFIAGDISSSFLPCKKIVPLSEKIIGEPLAEIIYIKNGKVIRKEKNASMIMNLIKRQKMEGRILAKPNYYGLTIEEIDKLKNYCDKIVVFTTYPMAPIIFVALLLTLLFGKHVTFFINI